MRLETLLLHLDGIDKELQTNSVGGFIYVTLGGWFFPEEQWYDLISADLESWLPNLTSFSQEHSDYCVLQFVDGPCCIKLKRDCNGTVSAACFWNSKNEIPWTEIDFLAFLVSVVKCVNTYCKLLFMQGENTRFEDDILKLKPYLSILRSLSNS